MTRKFLNSPVYKNQLSWARSDICINNSHYTFLYILYMSHSRASIRIGQTQLILSKLAIPSLCVCVYLYMYICVCVYVYASVRVYVYAWVSASPRTPRLLQWLLYNNEGSRLNTYFSGFDSVIKGTKSSKLKIDYLQRIRSIAYFKSPT